MRNLFLAAVLGSALATPLYAQNICSLDEAYRFGHEGREQPSICAGNAQYDQEYNRGARDGRGAVLGTLAAGAILGEALDDDDDFFYHDHHHRHDGYAHTHRHRHHNSHGGEHHGMHGSHHDHDVGSSGGHFGGGHGHGGHDHGGHDHGGHDHGGGHHH